MDEDKIFGPLTFRQFIYFVAGIVLIYLINTHIESKVSFLLMAIVTGVVYTLIINAPSIVIDENYIKSKRHNSKSIEEFQKWLSGKIASVSFQIEFRKSKGLVPDPKLDEVLRILENASINIK